MTTFNFVIVILDGLIRKVSQSDDGRLFGAKAMNARILFGI